MDREKEIQEIATVDSVCAKAEAACKKCAKKCVHYYRAIDLYNAGYRKADEVRKETAKEIIAKLTDDLACIEYPPERQLIKGYIEIFKKQYDLEASK